MSREEAIEIFKRLKENAPNEMHLETVESAQELFSMAIQALSQEPCDDVVSRQAVINAIENDCMKGGLGSCFACYNDAQAFRGEIEKLPSVTQKSGKWIRVTDKTGRLVWECDKCGWQQRLSNNFCPDCGARMVEPQESEDDACKDCDYNDGEVHAECVVCDKAESEE